MGFNANDHSDLQFPPELVLVSVFEELLLYHFPALSLVIVEESVLVMLYYASVL